MAREPLKPHPHKPVNVNALHKEEQVGINQRIALAITNALGSIPCMYFFIILALIGFPGLHATLVQYVQWFSQTGIQLVALSVLGIAQNILNRQQELQADEEYAKTLKIYHDTELLIKHYNSLLEEIDYLKNTIVLIYSEQIKHTDLLNKPSITTRRKTKQEVSGDE